MSSARIVEPVWGSSPRTQRSSHAAGMGWTFHIAFSQQIAASASSGMPALAAAS
jgi:hypothetical protein